MTGHSHSDIRTLRDLQPAKYVHHLKLAVRGRPCNSLYLQQVADLLDDAHRISIFAGRGCLHAKNEVTALVEKLGAPIIKFLLDK